MVFPDFRLIPDFCFIYFLVIGPNLHAILSRTGEIWRKYYQLNKQFTGRDKYSDKPQTTEYYI